jgi:hypothetical protein
VVHCVGALRWSAAFRLSFDSIANYWAAKNLLLFEFTLIVGRSIA